MDSEVPMTSKLPLLFSIPYPAHLATTDTVSLGYHHILGVGSLEWYIHTTSLMNYGMRFVTLYRRQGSRPSPSKRNAKKQNGYLGRPYK